MWMFLVAVFLNPFVVEVPQHVTLQFIIHQRIEFIQLFFAGRFYFWIGILSAKFLHTMSWNAVLALKCTFSRSQLKIFFYTSSDSVIIQTNTSHITYTHEWTKIYHRHWTRKYCPKILVCDTLWQLLRTVKMQSHWHFQDFIICLHFESPTNRI